MARLVLPNGKSVRKPFPKIWIVLGVLAVLVYAFVRVILLDPGLSPDYFRPSQIWVILKQMFVPRGTRTWGDYFKYALKLKNPLLQTVKMCLAGTLLGTLLAIPYSIFCAKNITRSRGVYLGFRTVLNLVRTIPVIVLAILAVMFVGTGVLSGIIALTLFTFGIMAKMLFEVIETVDMNPYEALESTGAGRLACFRYAVVPQIAPLFVSYFLYILEMNIRSSAILAFVGAEGLGSVINDNILYDYNKVGMTVLVLMVLVLFIQSLSGLARRHLS